MNNQKFVLFFPKTGLGIVQLEEFLNFGVIQNDSVDSILNRPVVQTYDDTIKKTTFPNLYYKEKYRF